MGKKYLQCPKPTRYLQTEHTRDSYKLSQKKKKGKPSRKIDTGNTEEKIQKSTNMQRDAKTFQ